MDGAEFKQVVNDVLRDAPQCVRVDLASKERLIRGRAEETLAAMIAAALAIEPTLGEKFPSGDETSRHD
jgi:hypothetical protein